MPDISLIPEVLYNALDPYHYQYDNLPLKNILKRQEVINDAVDKNSDDIYNSIGTQGTLANRLSQSLEDDGSLKIAALDDAMHNIAYHTDGSISSVDYVRMLLDERDKLSTVSDNASALQIMIETPSVVTYKDETVQFADSTSITWTTEAPNKIKAETVFPVAAAHMHYYDASPITVDYENYSTPLAPAEFVDGSLRVYINGVRINETDDIYVPAFDPEDSWTLTSFTSDYTNGTFVINRTLDVDDVIKIDFDAAF